MLTLERLMFVTLFISIAALTMSCAALWPHSRENFSRVRDTVLWLAFVFLIVGVMTVGWRQLENHYAQELPPWSAPSTQRLEYAGTRQAGDEWVQPVRYRYSPVQHNSSR